MALSGLARELGINHHHEMLESGKPLAPFVTTMRCNKVADLASRKALYDLLERLTVIAGSVFEVSVEIAVLQLRFYYNPFKQRTLFQQLQNLAGQ